MNYTCHYVDIVAAAVGRQKIEFFSLVEPIITQCKNLALAVTVKEYYGKNKRGGG
jgi:hypothetical protein